MAHPVYEKLMRAYESIRKITDFKPDIALVLGSGLGDFGETISDPVYIDYNQITDFPVSTVPGHKGRFICGYIKDIPVICMQGRVHYYEGYSIQDVVMPARLMGLMGAKVLFLTNASGGTKPGMRGGELMMIRDHISLFVPNPLIGPNIEELGTRFPDMTHVYDEELCACIRSAADAENITLDEGVYVQLTGPSYESPADVRLCKALGGDAIGMSTVVEAIAARHMGMRVCGISCISNAGAGLVDVELNHEDVKKAADEAGPKFIKLVTKSIINIGKTIVS